MTLHAEIVELETTLRDLERRAAERYGDDFAPGDEWALPDGVVPPDILTMGLVGGTGVGKSTIVNALARSDISAASVRRPTTDRILPYVHVDRVDVLKNLTSLSAHLSERTSTHEVERLRSVLLFDLPDMDSLEERHAAIVEETLKSLDIVVWVTSLTKYGDSVFHDWVARYSQGHDVDNFAYVVNKIDEIDAPDAVAAARELDQRFADTLAESLPPGTATRRFLVSARRHGDGLPGCSFGAFEAWLFHERGTREVERIKSSNRVALLSRRVAATSEALCLEERLRHLREELDTGRAEVREVVRRPEVLGDIAAAVDASTVRDELANRLFKHELEGWPLLGHLRFLVAPLQQTRRVLGRLAALAGADDEPAVEGRGPLRVVRGAVEELARGRRLRRSRLLEPGLVARGTGDAREIGPWLKMLERESINRAREAFLAGAEGDTVHDPQAPTRLIRRVLVWAPLVWFPFLQPVLRQVFNPNAGTASLGARLAYEMIRITGAMHLLVSLAFVLLVYAIILIWIRVRAGRAADRTSRGVLESDWWTETLEQRVADYLMADLITGLKDAEEELRCVESLQEKLRGVEERLES